MRNPINVLSSLQQHSSDKSYTYERLYRNLYREFYLLAYQNIYANEGNMTKGTDGKTIDAMSLKRIDKLIESLKSESYQPNPSRRTYIPKKNGKMRPLGIPSFDDKLIQEVLRMILQAIYEGYFEKSSHGFRPNKSCHTALDSIQKSFSGAKWFIEGDIKGFFDNIDHKIMISVLSKRIKDEKFLRLINKFLKAGYLEQWQYHNSYSGTPQGGIISPILANIYLDEFDKYMQELKSELDKGKGRKPLSQAIKLESHLQRLRRKLSVTTDENERKAILQKITEIQKEKYQTPYSDPMDNDFKRLQYVRYADDFIIGIVGSKEDAKSLKIKIAEYLQNSLKLELSEEKTLITNSSDKAKFLGYEIYVRKTNAVTTNKNGVKSRYLNGSVCLSVSMQTIRDKLLEYKAMRIETTVYGKENFKPKSRYYLKDNDDLEILEQYNSEIRGIRNYYSLANNSSIVSSFGYIMQYSMFKTFATKYRTSVRKITQKLRIGKGFGVQYKDKKGNLKTRLFYNNGFSRKKLKYSQNVDILPRTIMYTAKTSLKQRLEAGKCEYCGNESGMIEIHHVRKLKDLKGKSRLETFMIARNRKTIALCRQCHSDLHLGRLN
ncbi:group II intron reverse transcriptase/maturase [Aminipila sp.]|uniref:group II intron reverse transcriptase/maturase n=1 Tax=Aminipila sp. TaxID=2060095 RepID=UPI00289C8A40|nr:group II intron reverse transcriptase/maturase [Aminipila sp.]